jgi:hypothetical protein
VLYPRRLSSVYNYVCFGDDDGLFNFAVEWRYHLDIIGQEGDPTGREIEYNCETKQLVFLD